MHDQTFRGGLPSIFDVDFFLCNCIFIQHSNIAAAKAVDREFNYKFGSNLGLFDSGRGSNGRGAPVGSIWAEFQLKQSHGDPFRDQNHVFVRPVLPWY